MASGQGAHSVDRNKTPEYANPMALRSFHSESIEDRHLPLSAEGP